MPPPPAGRLARVLKYQLKAALEADHPNLLVVVDERDVRRWHFLVTGLADPYAGGEYAFSLTAPDTFPQQPPEFQFLTPNGVYEPGGKICISIGEYHAGDHGLDAHGGYGWRPALGMIGFAGEVVNGLIDPDHLGTGIRIAVAAPARRRELAAGSEPWNAERLPGLMDQFDAFEAGRPESAGVRGRQMRRAAGALLGPERRLPENPPLSDLAGAFGAEAWARLSATALGLADSPERRALLAPAAKEVCAALVEHDPAIRRALVLALDVRLRGDSGDARGAAAALGELLAALPGVCGGACRDKVPRAMARVAAAPALFPRIHAGLSEFLRAPSIDEKARLGFIFALTTVAAANKTSQ